MFGRRPQPALRGVIELGKVEFGLLMPQQRLGVRLMFQIKNNGRALARDLYSDIHIRLPGDASGAEFRAYRRESANWNTRISPTRYIIQTSKDGFKLAPHSFNRPCELTLIFTPPFPQDGRLALHWTFGCDGSSVNLIKKEYDRSDIERLYRDCMTTKGNDVELRRIVKSLFS
jgi:hypothetical protein